MLIRRFAKMLVRAGLEAYHEKGDEFICRGRSRQDLERKLLKAQYLMRTQPFSVRGLDGQITTVMGADFGFGIGATQQEAEKALKQSKKMSSYRRWDICGTIVQTPASSKAAMHASH